MLWLSRKRPEQGLTALHGIFMSYQLMTPTHPFIISPNFSLMNSSGFGGCRTTRAENRPCKATHGCTWPRVSIETDSSYNIATLIRLEEWQNYSPQRPLVVDEHSGILSKAARLVEERADGVSSRETKSHFDWVFTNSSPPEKDKLLPSNCSQPQPKTLR